MMACTLAQPGLFFVHPLTRVAVQPLLDVIDLTYFDAVFPWLLFIVLLMFVVPRLKWERKKDRDKDGY